MAIRSITPYLGSVPDKTTMSKEQFADAVYSTHLFYDQSFVSDVNNVVDDINFEVEVINAMMVYNNFKGDYDALSIYALGDSVSYNNTVYFSKITNNVGNTPPLSEPELEDDFWKAANVDLHGVAFDVDYDNATSGLSAINVQDAIDEVKDGLDAANVEIDTKQVALISGTNIKTLSGASLLGSGDLNLINAVLPSQGGNYNKFLTTNGANASWADVPTEINDGAIVINATWSSSKINAMITNNPIIDDTAIIQTKTWSSSKIATELSTTAQIDDAAQTNTTTWSSNQIASVISNTVENSSEISDILIAPTSTWSSTKIQAELDAVFNADITTPVPQLDVASINDNALTVHTINITNYNVAVTYTVTSSDTAVATVSRTNGVITVTLADNQTSTTSTATISVYTYESTYDLSGLTTIGVSNHSVIVPDGDLAQVVDFSVVEESKADFTYSGTTTGSLIASSNSATFTSDTIEQDALEGDWTSWEATLESESYGERARGVSVVGSKIVLDYNSLFIQDDELSILLQNNSILSLDNAMVTKTALSGSSLTAQYNANQFLAGNCYGMNISRDGKWFYFFIDSGEVVYKNIATPWKESEVTAPIFLNVDTALSSFMFNDNGTKFFTYSYTTKLIKEYELSSAWDVTTRVYNRQIELINATVLDSTSRLRFSFCGKYIYANKSVSGTIYVYQYTLGTAWDISTISYTGFKSFAKSNYRAVDLQISLDGANIFLLEGYGTYDTYIVSYALSTAYDITTMSTSGSGKLSYGGEDAPLSMCIPIDGSCTYHIGNTEKKVIRAILSSNYLWKSTLIDASSLSLTSLPKAIGYKIGNDLTLDTNIIPSMVSLGTALTPATTITTAEADKLKTVRTYTKVTETFRALKFKLDALKNNKITKLAITMTRESV